VSQFGTRLVVVMGHTRCGAVGATLRTLGGQSPDSRNIAAITERIAPHIRNCRTIDEAVAANVAASVDHLSHGSRIIEELVERDRVKIVGTVYAVESGVVSVI
jgi:carbonic anhydrase